jgi:hypothetical protein
MRTNNPPDGWVAIAVIPGVVGIKVPSASKVAEWVGESILSGVGVPACGLVPNLKGRLVHPAKISRDKNGKSRKRRGSIKDRIMVVTKALPDG